MNQYAYMGAAWANQANANRKSSQQWAQYNADNAAQMSGLRVGRRQLQNQMATNQMQRRDQTFRFGLGALTGLLR